MELARRNDTKEQMMGEVSSTNYQTSINIRAITEVVCSIEGKLCQKSQIPSKCFIFKVPEQLRRHNEKDFEPVLVSIGPFHHGKEKLQAMQKIKLWYLHCLLNRAPTRETTLKCFVESIGRIEQECRASYEEEIGFVKKDFIEMMVVDGCFIIEFFRKASKEVQQDEEDPVFYKAWMLWRLLIDLSLLENQLPWRVLDFLFNLTKSRTEHRSLSNLVLSCFLFKWPPRDNLKHKHILDCLLNSFIGTCTITSTPETTIFLYNEQIPSVIGLVQAGVKFKAGDRNSSLLDVTFKDGVMTIPPRFVSEKAETIFINLIAFEQCDPNKVFKIASYAKFLDDLIKTSQDVDFLKNKGILKIYLSPEDVASFFNRFYRDVVVCDFLYLDLYREVNAYIKRPWNRWQSILKRDYFGNPWTILSLLATILFLVFSFLQTFYSAFSYYN